jgi:AcrR family transcriptional regulator
MPPEGLFERADDETRTAIMAATYRALTEHGYADLTVQRIADQFDKSKSLLYHHYDGKDDLLTGFLEFALDHFEDGMSLTKGNRPDERLRVLFDVLVGTDSEVDEEFVAVLVELRAQAVNDADYRNQFAKNDEFFRDHIADVVRDGIEEGVFREVDPKQTASFLLTVINGGLTERTTTENRAVARCVRAELDEYLDAHLLADGRGDGRASETDAHTGSTRRTGE